MRFKFATLRVSCAAVLALIAAGAAEAASPPELIARGEYLARAANCVSCHSTPDGEPLDRKSVV